MKLSYVGDGPRDEAMLPPLVRNVVGDQEPRFEAWHDIRLNRGRGYARKLAYAAARARDVGDDGVVAVLDTDGDPSRAATLADERERQRRTDALPIAVGAAHPHGEAWLVDDLEPLRQILDLPATAPAPRGLHPKDELNALIDASPLERMEAIAQLAGAVSVERCRRARDTGLAAFLTAVRVEFGR
ncbi:MAG: hypothetical protein R3F59_35260 [Myxococcota bacterium]